MDISDSKRLRLNVFFGILNSIASAVQTFWLIPYIKTYLGVTAYGYVAVVNGIVSTLLVVSTAIASMGTRFILVNLESHNEYEARKYFNSEFVAMLISVLFLLMVGFVLIWNLNLFMTVKQSFYRDVQILFAMTVFSFCIQLVQSPFSASFYYTNAVYLTYLLYIIDYTGRILVTFVMYNSGNKVLWSAALSTDIVYVAGLAFYVYYSNKRIETLKINFHEFDWKHLEELIKSGIWISISSAGNMLLSSLNSYFSNIFCGVVITGIYASIMQFNVIETMILMVLVNSLLPKMFKLFSHKDDKALFRYTIFSMVIVSLFLSVLTSGIIVYGNDFMNFWMGKEFVGYNVLILLTVLHLPFTLPSQVLNQTFTVMNKVKIPAITTIMFGILNVLLVVIATNFFNMNIYGIAIASLSVQVLRDMFFYPIYFLKVTSNYTWKILIPFIIGVLGMSGSLAICCTVHLIVPSSSLAMFGVSILIAGSFSMGYVYLVGKYSANKLSLNN